jgi:hypothetical protein
MSIACSHIAINAYYKTDRVLQSDQDAIERCVCTARESQRSPAGERAENAESKLNERMVYRRKTKK